MDAHGDVDIPSRQYQRAARLAAESFTNVANRIDEDHALGHLVATAWATSGRRLRADLLTGETDPCPLATPPVERSIVGCAALLSGFLNEAEANAEEPISTAELFINVDPARRRQYPGTAWFESPFSVEVRLTDHSGERHGHTIFGWTGPRQTIQTNSHG